MSDLTVLFYPEALRPAPLSRVYRMCQKYGVNYHNDITKPYDVFCFWSYTKHSIEPDAFILNTKGINTGCWNISKVKVNKIFGDLFIDPPSYVGKCVEKLDRQGAHYGHKVIDCPTEPKDGYVYQKFIVNKEDDLYVKYAAYIYGDKKFCVKSYKRSPFSSKYLSNEYVYIRECFTEEQERDFDNKCKSFGVDMACVEFLMLDGKPVVIDVNNVIGGKPVSKLSGTEIDDNINDSIIEYFYDRAGKVFQKR